jgi:hypothetical protein
MNIDMTDPFASNETVSFSRIVELNHVYDYS